MRSMYLRIVVMLVMLGAIVPASTVDAAEIRQGNLVTVGDDEEIDDDFYAAGSEIVIRGIVNGDVTVVGSSIRIEGTVNGNVNAAGSNVVITGTVRNSVRAAGGTVLVSGTIGRDVVAAGGNVEFASLVRIDHDLFVGAGSARIAGTIGRDFRASGGEMYLNAAVGRQTEVQAQKLTVGNTAQVAGDLRYWSQAPAEISRDARIAGTVTYQPVPAGNAPEASPSTHPVVSTFLEHLTAMVTPIVLGLLGLWLVPAAAGGFATTARRRIGMSALTGTGVLILAPIIGLMLFGIGLFTGGASLGMLVIGATWALSVAVRAAIGLALGTFLFEQLRPAERPVPWQALLVGLAVIEIVAFIPVIGVITNLMVTFLGVGAMVLWLVQAYEAARPISAAPQYEATPLAQFA